MIKGSLQTVARAETGELRGGALYRGILSEILFGKGTTNSLTDQTNSEKNSGNIKTAFGRNLENAINNNREEFIYPDEIKKTDERAAPDSLTYTHRSSYFDGKGTTNSGREQGNSEKNSGNLQGGEDVVFSISPEQDREYMAAVESGDMEKAGAMEKAAFKARFPWVSAPVSLTLSKKLSETFVHFKILLYLCNAKHSKPWQI